MLPDSINLPLRVAVSRVVNLSVALAAAILAFVPISRAEHAPAMHADAVHDGADSFKEFALPFEAYRRVGVQPVSKTHEIVAPAYPNYSCELRLVVRASTNASYTNGMQDVVNSMGHSVRGCDVRADHLWADVDASIAVEKSPYEMVQERLIQRRHCEAMGLAAPEAKGLQGLDHFQARQGDCCFSMIDSNRVGRSNVRLELLDVADITDSKREHDATATVATVRGEKPEPVRLAFGIDVVEEVLVKRVNTRTGHGSL